MPALSGGRGRNFKAGGSQKKGPQVSRSMKATEVEFLPSQVKKLKIQQATAGTSFTNTSNRFLIGKTPLSDFNMDDDSCNENTDGANATPVLKRFKTPPITVVSQNVTAIQGYLNDAVKSQKFQMELKGIGIRVQIVQKDEFDNFCKLLSEKEIDFFNYHTSDTKPRKIVLTKLHKMDVLEVRKLLATVNIDPTDIKLLNLRGNRYAYDTQAVYLLYFEPGKAKLSEIRKIRTLGNLSVHFEAYQPRANDMIPQCRNCQMYGHSSVNCHMKTKCLVCADNHKTDSCPKKVTREVLAQQLAEDKVPDRSFIKCANCEEPHTANYKGCIARQSYLQLQEKLRNKTRRGRQGYRPNPQDFPPTFGPQTPQHAADNLDWSGLYRNNRQTADQPPQSADFQTLQQQMMNQMQLMSQMMSTVNTMLSKLSEMIELLTKTQKNRNNNV